jgi:multidrug efflux system membrane fusion protein
MRPIKVAKQDDTQSVISEGLSAADLVVTAGFARLKDGAEVQVSAPGEEGNRSAPAASATQPGAPASETASITPTEGQAGAPGESRGKRGEGRKHGRKREADAVRAVGP